MKPSIPAAIMLTASMACRPVIAIGWTELAIIFVIIIVLFAPVLFRLFRFFTRNEESTDNESEYPES